MPGLVLPDILAVVMWWFAHNTRTRTYIQIHGYTDTHRYALAHTVTTQTHAHSRTRTHTHLLHLLLGAVGEVAGVGVARHLGGCVSQRERESSVMKSQVPSARMESTS